MLSNNSMQITTAVLSNGMRAIHHKCEDSAVEICGVCIGAGSRNEQEDEHGLAHFVEHTIFKGTTTKRSSSIIRRMESIGGELNAYTTKEETVVYSIFPAGNLNRAAELISDLCANSRFPDKELDKEREVVADEIDSYLDTPSEAIYDDFEDLIFAGSPLGHNILGNPYSIRYFDSKACSHFIRRNYRADNMVVFYSGPKKVLPVFRVLNRFFTIIKGNKPEQTEFQPPIINKPFERIHNISTHQAHSIIGARVGSYLSPDRYATALLVNMTGGPGMNSLLNVELREKRGLVYNVEASTALYSDCGLMTVYYGCDPQDAEDCRNIVAETFGNIVEKLTQTKLKAAKKQYLGQLVVASENRENSVLAAARSMLWRGHVILPSQTEQAIADLTLEDIKRAVQPMLEPSLLTFSPE